MYPRLTGTLTNYPCIMRFFLASPTGGADISLLYCPTCNTLVRAHEVTVPFVCKNCGNISVDGIGDHFFYNAPYETIAVSIAKTLEALKFEADIYLKRLHDENPSAVQKNTTLTPAQMHKRMMKAQLSADNVVYTKEALEKDLAGGATLTGRILAFLRA